MGEPGVMRSKLLHPAPDRTWLLVFAKGDPVIEGLTEFAREQGLTGARLWGIGALEHVDLGFYRHARRDYDRFALAEELELLALNGNLAVTDDGPRVHAHAMVGRSDGTAHGGHLFEGRVGPTLEVFVVESPVEIRREMDEEFGLPLIQL
jgi:predicted DNA-binding protein with PD1-like motif